MANTKNRKSKPKTEFKKPIVELEEQARYVIFKNGEQKKIVGETGKYWICENGQYRKLSNDIEEVRVVVEIEEKESEEFDKGFENIPDASEIEEEMDRIEEMIEKIGEGR